MLRTQLHSDPTGRFVHELVLESCARFPRRTALVDTSVPEGCRLTYGEYGERVRRLAAGLIRAGIEPGNVLGIYLPNSWEFCAAYHAATLAGAIPTPLNPSFREREVRYQLENSGAAMLITDGPQILEMNLDGLPQLRRVVFTRERGATAAEPFADLLADGDALLPSPNAKADATLAALPYSSGTTGLPKGVMLSHTNLVANVFQILAAAPFAADEIALCFLPLYHIYGLNVVLNPVLMLGATLVLMPRFDCTVALRLIAAERITFMPVVPPVLNAMVEAAEHGLFPKKHKLRWIKCGAAPLAAELPRRFTKATGIRVVQGYGMTEASPVTHIGFLDGPLYRPESIGVPVAQTECVLVNEEGVHRVGDVNAGGNCDQTGELAMRGPQFMLGYWNAPEATAEVLHPLPDISQRDRNVPANAMGSAANEQAEKLWYFSGDVARVDRQGLFYIVDRRKEMIKYKGFAVAPAEVEAVLLEHPAVRDCGVIGRYDDRAGEVPVAFLVLRDGREASRRVEEEIREWLGTRLTGYKQPRELRFVPAIPRNPSGKILRRELRRLL